MNKMVWFCRLRFQGFGGDLMIHGSALPLSLLFLEGPEGGIHPRFSQYRSDQKGKISVNWSGVEPIVISVDHH